MASIPEYSSAKYASAGYPLCFWDYYVFQQDGAPAHRARDTVTMLQRETPEFIPPEMWPPNLPAGGLQHLGYASREGLPLVDP